HAGGEAALRRPLPREDGGDQGPRRKGARRHRPRIRPRAGEAFGCRDRGTAHRRARHRALDRGDAAHLPPRAPRRPARDRLRRAQGIREGAGPQGLAFSEGAAGVRRALAAVPDGGELVPVARARPVALQCRAGGAARRPAFARAEGMVSTRTTSSFGSISGPWYRRNAAGPVAYSQTCWSGAETKS